MNEREEDVLNEKEPSLTMKRTKRPLEVEMEMEEKLWEALIVAFCLMITLITVVVVVGKAAANGEWSVVVNCCFDDVVVVV